MKSERKTYWKLFISTFYLSSFTFGGGFVIVPLMKKKFVDDLKWIEEKEILNLTAIAQSAPGAVAVNASILLGYSIGGVLGAIIAILGTVLPPLMIMSAVSLFYTAFHDNVVLNALLKGMQSGVAAVIMDVVLRMGGNIIKEKSVLPVVLMVAAFIATYFFHINIIYIILFCGIAGAISAVICDRWNLCKDNPIEKDNMEGSMTS